MLGGGGGRAGIGVSGGCGVGGGRRGDRRRGRDAGQPGGRVPVVIVVSLQMGVAVFLGALTASYSWCLSPSSRCGASPQACSGRWAAIRGWSGPPARALVISPPVAPSLTGVVFSTLLTVVAGCVQAVLIAVWPPQRWRVQRDALTGAYRTLAADARRVAADRDASVDAAPLTSLREAFVDSEATRRPMAYHGGYRLPERITATLAPWAAETRPFR